MEKEDLLIVGLGNPGQNYENTRHNIGFIVVDHLHKSWNGSAFSEKWKGLYVSLRMSGKKIHLVKPLTYMNRSGESVREFFRFFKIQPAKLLIVHDDLDMSTGRIKLVKGGGSGGHNGIKSITEQLGIKDFYRLKIGIGRPGKGDVHRDYPVEKYVLSTFSDAESEFLLTRKSEIERGIEYFIAGDTERAMGVLNSLK